MELDLLFLAVEQSNWRSLNKETALKPDSFDRQNYILSFTGDNVERILNNKFNGEDVLLLVIDPLRIQSPIKKIKEDDTEYVAIQGEITFDAIIDKIKLKSSKDGTYSVNVKHFD